MDITLKAQITVSGEVIKAEYQTQQLPARYGATQILEGVAYRLATKERVFVDFFVKSSLVSTCSSRVEIENHYNPYFQAGTLLYVSGQVIEDHGSIIVLDYLEMWEFWRATIVQIDSKSVTKSYESTEPVSVSERYGYDLESKCSLKTVLRQYVTARSDCGLLLEFWLILEGNSESPNIPLDKAGDRIELTGDVIVRKQGKILFSEARILHNLTQNPA
jgi:hypothetical protein